MLGSFFRRDKRVRVRIMLVGDEVAKIDVKQRELGVQTRAEVIRRALEKLYDDVCHDRLIDRTLLPVGEAVPLEFEASNKTLDALDELAKRLVAWSRTEVVRIAINNFCC